MTVPVEAVAGHSSPGHGEGRGWFVARSVLLAMLASVALGAVASGSAPGSLSELESVVRTGQVRGLSPQCSSPSLSS